MKKYFFIFIEKLIKIGSLFIWIIASKNVSHSDYCDSDKRSSIFINSWLGLKKWLTELLDDKNK